MKNTVQQLREEKGLTQTELAEISGLSLRTIQRVEAGVVPKGFTLKALAEALKTTPEKLSGTSIFNGIERAKLINTSSLCFLVLPFGNIIIPAMLTYRTSDPLAKNLGKQLLSIQILWTLITCLVMIILPFIQKIVTTTIPLFLIALILLVCVNVYIIFKNGAGLNQQNGLHIKLKNSIL